MSIGAMEVVHDAEDAETFDELAVMIVVGLGGWKTGQMIAAVIGDSSQNDQRKPDPTRSHVRAC